MPLPAATREARQLAGASQAEPIEIKRFALQDIDGIAEALAGAPAHLVRWQLTGSTTEWDRLEALVQQLSRHPRLSDRHLEFRVNTEDTQPGWVQMSPDGR